MNQTRTWNYDAASQRLTSMALPESGATSYSYTAADGTLDTKTDARGTERSMSTTYPNGHFDGAAPTFKRYEYEYDTMGRPSKMKEERFDQNGNRYWADLVAAAVKYGPRGEITEFNGEVRQYNVMGQLTGIGSYMCGGWACYGQPPVPAIEYRYSATQNNGQITSTKDNATGEEVVYQYDGLSRLTSATRLGWVQGFEYDGWANLLAKTGTGA